MSEENFVEGQQVWVEGVFKGRQRDMISLQVTYGQGVTRDVMVPEAVLELPIEADCLPGDKIRVKGVITHIQTHHNVQSDYSSAVTVRISFGKGPILPLPQEAVSAIAQDDISQPIARHR